MSPQEIELHLSALQNLILDNTVLIAAGGLCIWLITSLLLSVMRHKDKKIPFLAEFFGVDPERIIALPPSTALWNDYYRLSSEVSADSHFPQGAPTLQGSYLIHAQGGMTLVAVHNFDVHDIYRDPEEPELFDYIVSSIGSHGRLEPHRIPVDIDEDAARRSDIVEYLLKMKFGYPGKVRAITLLRDKDATAPDADLLYTPSGEDVHRFTFAQQKAARAALYFEDQPVEARSLPKIRRWFLSYPGRQTSRPRLIARLLLLSLTAGLLGFGFTSFTPEALSFIVDAITQ